MNDQMSTELSLIKCLVSNVLFELNDELIKKRIPNSLLSCEDRRIHFYDFEKNIYIFDQPADVFEVLVYFISTGLLSRPININEKDLYSLLIFFEIDQTVIDTFKKMNHIVDELIWEDRQSLTASWLENLFSYPITSKSKLINTFFFAVTILSYGNLCFEYTFALPLFHSSPSSTDNTTRILTPIGLDFSSTEHFSYFIELIYLIILIIEFLCRFLYISNKMSYFLNYLTMIDLFSILSCLIYLYSIFQMKSNCLIACFRLIRILKLSRYSPTIHHYFQTIISQIDFFILLLFLFISLGLFFGNFIYGLSLIDRSHSSSTTPWQSFYYVYETIFTIGFGIHLPSIIYLSWITLTSVLFGMICLSLPVPFLAIYSLNLEIYEQEEKKKSFV